MADTEPSKKTSNKRRLRPTTTVRQQAEKAQADANKGPSNRRLRAAATTSRRPLAKLGKLFNRQPFRFIGIVLLPPFVRNAFKELRMVTWPNRRETARLTFAVIMFAIVFGVVIFLVDYGLDKIFKALILN